MDQAPFAIPDASRPPAVQPHAVTDAQASRIVAEIGIPPCPAILTEMLREAREDEPDFHAIGRLLTRDLGLSAIMLKTVNSPFYGLRSKATSVQQALVYLGIRQVVQLVTGLLLHQVFPVTRGEVMGLLWESSARMAASVSWLATELGFADRDEAYTFGLFRDCGLLLMARKYPDYGALVYAHGLPHPRTMVDDEGAKYVTDHAQVGYHMARSWYLPDDLCLAVRHHHDAALFAGEGRALEGKARELVAVSMLADRFSMEATQGGHRQALPGEDEAVLECLGVDAGDLADLAEGARQAQDEESAD